MAGNSLSGLRPGFPERGGFADKFNEIERRLVALEQASRLAVGPTGQVHIGADGEPEGQLFISNILQHVNLIETDDPNPPEGGIRIWVVDAHNSRYRVLSLAQVDETETFEDVDYLWLRRLADTASGETVMYLAYHNGSDHVLERVTVGAEDSGGSGFRVLRVPN